MATTPNFDSGKSSQFGDVVPVFVFNFPTTLTTVDNARIPWLSLPRPIYIWQLRAFLKTAPTGQAVIVNFKRVTLATGVVGASLGTVTIAVGAFEGTTTVLATPVALPITEGVAMEITQIGSGVAGSDLTGFVDGTKGS